MGKCKECWDWINDPSATCQHDSRKKDAYGRCTSCMSRYYYLRRTKGIGDAFGTIRISRNRPLKFGPEYEAKSRRNKALAERKKIQNNRCAICGLEDEKGLCLDHDHSCCGLGKTPCEKCIRGALCHGCNMRLGQLESPLVQRSLDYLEKYRKIKQCQN